LRPARTRWTRGEGWKGWSPAQGSTDTAPTLVARAVSPYGIGAEMLGVDGATDTPYFRPVVSHQSVTLAAVHSGKRLEVAGASTVDGATVHQWGGHGGTHQRWRLDPVGQSTYLLVAMHSGKCLAVAGGATANGTPVNQYPVLDHRRHWSGDRPGPVLWRLLTGGGLTDDIRVERLRRVDGQAPVLAWCSRLLREAGVVAGLAMSAATGHRVVLVDDLLWDPAAVGDVLLGLPRPFPTGRGA
jgi:hypothetical protein